MFSFLFLIASVFAVEATLTDGQQLGGELRKIANGRVTLKTDDGERDFDSQRVDKLIFSNESANTLPAAVTVELSDGSTFGVQGVQIVPADTTQPRDKVSAVFLNGNGHKSTCPVPVIRSIRYAVKDGQLIEQWQEIRQKANKDASSDLLVINRSGNLDYLAGVIQGFDTEQIQFEYSGDSLNIPLSRAAGLIFANSKQSIPAAKFVLTSNNGSVWQLKELSYSGSLWDMTSASGSRHQLANNNVKSIEFVRTGVDYASDLKGQDIDYEPFLQSPTIGPSLSKLGQPQLDRSFDSSMLSVMQDGKRRVFKRGLAMKSRSQVTYRLAKKYQRFQTTAGMAPQAAKQGDIDLQIMADNKEVFRQSISKSDPPVEIDIPVADANRLTIMVDYGQNLDIGDQLHLGDARFTK